MSQKSLLKQQSRSGLSLVEVLITIGLIGLFFYGVFASLQSSLYLISEGKIKTSANALAVERIEKIRSLDYNNVGTYVDDGSCVYEVDCAVGVPAGPIPQEEDVNLNKMDFVISTIIDNVDSDADGQGVSDSNGVINDYKSVVVEVGWQGRQGFNSIRLSTIVAPVGVESNVGGGSLRVNVIDSSGDPVSGLDVLIVNNSITPTISQPGVTDVDGRRLLSGLEQAAGYEVFVNLDTTDVDGNGRLDDLVNDNHGYARVYEAGEIWPANNTTAELTNPNPDKLTVEESLITTITFVIDPTNDFVLQVNEEPNKEVITSPFSDISSFQMVNLVAEASGLILDTDAVSGGRYTSGSLIIPNIVPTDDLSRWLWAEFMTTNESATETIIAQILYPTGGSYSLIPDSDLPGNSVGFTADSEIDLQALDTEMYSELAIFFEFNGDGVSTPRLESAEASAITTGPAIEDAELRLYGATWVGRRQDNGNKIWKHDFELRTDVDGFAERQNLEADRYRPRWRNFGSYTEVMTCPAAAGNFEFPDDFENIESLWRTNADTSDTLVVSITTGSTVYPGVNVIADGFGSNPGDVMPRVGLTNECGQVVFPDLPAGEYELSYSGPGLSAGNATVDVSGLTNFEINP